LGIGQQTQAALTTGTENDLGHLHHQKKRDAGSFLIFSDDWFSVQVVLPGIAPVADWSVLCEEKAASAPGMVVTRGTYSRWP
jgi:hypothetical protein